MLENQSVWLFMLLLGGAGKAILATILMWCTVSELNVHTDHD